MEIILKDDVKGLGFKNDIVTVKPGYGRNYLIPGFQLGNCLLELLLLFLLRSNQEEIEHPEDEDHRQQKTKTTRTALEEK